MEPNGLIKKIMERARGVHDNEVSPTIIDGGEMEKQPNILQFRG
jgi:hypothetical protein